MLAKFVIEHNLSESFVSTAEQFYIPLADKVATRCQLSLNKPLFIGVNGCQGSGKSTLTAFLTEYLSENHQLNVVNLSLDDFYLSKQARIELSQKIHPLFATRGVPGTHNISLLSETLSQLKNSSAPIKLSKFNKATDDLYPESQWQTAPKHVDIVLFEGWCWGAQAQTEQALTAAINSVESEHDAKGIWRHYVNQQLKKHYQPLYHTMDLWLMLQAPSFACVEDWRWQQEEKLAVKNSGAGVMNKAQVQQFIQFYQRLTEVCLSNLPEKCHWVLTLDKTRKVTQMFEKDSIMEKQSLIFTDLDGTLLDHFDYSFLAASPIIEQLKKQKIPIIPNTSKTYAEMIKILTTINLNTPFIIENGAAIYIPIGYFDTQPEGTSIRGEYWVKEFCPPRAHWLELLANIEEKYIDLFQGFSKLSLEELCNLTGLQPENAEYALDRKYTEPLLWHGDNCNKAEFIAHMESLGAHMLQGGRFLHVGGHSDKGLALTWLANIYTKQLKIPVQTIALGDSHNDNEMLEIADIAIQIKSPIHPFPILNKSEQCFRSTEVGPKGWAECLSNILFLQSHPITIGA
ncbi:MAG: HAD-IIB family hydrolase [Thalassotalea sp.]